MFSETLYLIEQSLEKSAKSLYAYFLLDHDHLPNDKIYVRIKQLGHENWKTIPEIYIKICEIEKAFWDNMHFPDSQRQQVVLQAKQQIRKLEQNVVKFKDEIAKEITKRTSIESNLITEFPSEINQIYQKFKNFDQQIEAKAKKALQELNYTGTENVTKPHPFLTFFGLTRDLISWMMIRSDIYRYPSLQYQNRNLQMLNRPKMEQPCKQLLEIMEVCVRTIKPLMKGGGLAL